MTDHAPGGGFVDLDGRRFYRIARYDEMPPFFMTVVGADDVWLFISSTGGLTAGRVDRDHALFPYYTVDKVTESAGRTGGFTLLRVADGSGGAGESATYWQPFAALRPDDPPVERALYKDPLSTTLVFEERRPDLGLRMRVTWQTSGRFGLVRTCELATDASQWRANGLSPDADEQRGTDQPREVDVLDGFVNLLPAGVDYHVQNELSSLLDAYKRSELDAGTGLGMLYLNSKLTDLAEPAESLEANVAWQVGLSASAHLLSTQQVDAFTDGEQLTTETDVRGRRGAYLLRSTATVEPGRPLRWRVVADVDHDAAEVVELRNLLSDPVRAEDELADDIERTRTRLEAIVATADGNQLSGDEMAAVHHSANVLFNVMRGGLPVDGYTLDAADVRAFVRLRSVATATRNAELLDGLPATLRRDELVDICTSTGDVDLLRFALEYLPLTFSRRHGDPSRPWNKFRIALRDGAGDPLLAYEGNWRDIFQNWEALSWSFPEYLDSMIAIFLDATTADGYNPYRISRDGIDWEVPEPDDPWSNIGYWSDHQIIYLLKLLETSEQFHPGRLRDLVGRAIFTHADVPYRIASYRDTLADPYDTITFDEEHHDAIAVRVADEGADGRLVHDHDGDLVRVTLAEKLLLLLAAKLVNLVPDGGIWMNTQRPEWNDANNALAGRGLSVVTLAYLRRYIAFVRDLLDAEIEVTAELHELCTAIVTALAARADAADGGFDGASRRAVMNDLGTAGTAYRDQVYAGFSGKTRTLDADDLGRLLDLAQRYVDAGLRANRRDDGMYHSYNVLDLGDDTADVRRLELMLEGQVAVLSSGVLDGAESQTLLRALRNSGLYRADQHSYMLYPDRDLPSFLERNTFDAQQAATVPLIDALVEAGDRSIVVRDVDGQYHFAAGIHNARDVANALDALADDERLGDAVEHDRVALLDLFEDVFDHAAFTGRSGSFFAYEGLGSIYWHMVSKLLLAVQETMLRTAAAGVAGGLPDGDGQGGLAEQDSGADETASADDTTAALYEAYEEVRHGLGYCKSPEVYGAFPADPYSHSPSGRGAQQPGMTGQVKEEVLTRLGELGVRVEAGRLGFRPQRLRAEWTPEPLTFDYRDVRGEAKSLDLPAGALAFTFCQVPVVYERADDTAVVAHLADGDTVEGNDGALDADLSASIFRRDARVARIHVRVAR